MLDSRLQGNLSIPGWHFGHGHFSGRALMQPWPSGVETKCLFMVPSVVYLGHVIDKDGLHPTQGKADAIQEARCPTSATELRSFLYSTTTCKISPKLIHEACSSTHQGGDGEGNKRKLLPKLRRCYRVTLCRFILIVQNHFHLLVTLHLMGAVHLTC